jgi:hypothetical protein
MKSKVCWVCGDTDSQGHHENYSDPFTVTWLCDKHHKERHVFLREQQLLAKVSA